MSSNENIWMTLKIKLLVLGFYTLLAAVSTAVVLYGNIHGFYFNPHYLQ